MLFYTHAHRHYLIHYSREMQEIFRGAHNNKIQYFIEPFLIRSVHCKREHFWRWFLSSPLVLSRLSTAVVGFLSGSGSRYAIRFLIWGCITSMLAPNITTRWYQLLMKRICAGLNGPPPILPLFCFQLALWHNCDVSPTWPSVVGLAVRHSENNRPIRR